jgi:hypothetical protein
MARLQLVRRSGVEIVRRARSNGRFTPSHQGRRFGNRALPASFKAWQRRLLLLFHSTSPLPLPFPKNLRIQIPLGFHLLAANCYRLEAMAPRKATIAVRSSEVAPQPAAPLLESRIKCSRELQTV